MTEQYNEREINDSPELKEQGVETIDVIMQRHGQRAPDGWLTEAGAEEVEAETSRFIDSYLQEDSPPVTFFVLSSPSATYVNNEPVGRRAEQTGKISASVIRRAIEARGISADKAQLHEFGRTIDGTRRTPALQEPNYFYVEGSDNPTGYFDALIETLGKEGREEGYFAGPSDLEALRQSVGAESSKDVAKRMLRFTRALERYSDGYHKQHPGRKLVFLLETHGDVIRSTVQHGLGVDESTGWQPSTGESVKMELTHGKLAMDFNGMKYDVDLGEQ